METTTRERHAAPLDYGTPLPFERAQLQIGKNWCWAAVTASLVEQRDGKPVRQCDVVQSTLKAPLLACHLADIDGADLRPSRCEPSRCTVRRDADLPEDLSEVIKPHFLLYADVISYNQPPQFTELGPNWLQDGEPIPTQLEMRDIIRLINRLHYIVLRFEQGRRQAHFIVIYGYALSPSIQAVRFFDPANGTPAGLRLHNGHGVLPLREVKRRYGRLVNCLIINPPGGGPAPAGTVGGQDLGSSAGSDGAATAHPAA